MCDAKVRLEDIGECRLSKMMRRGSERCIGWSGRLTLGRVGGSGMVREAYGGGARTCVSMAAMSAVALDITSFKLSVATASMVTLFVRL